MKKFRKILQSAFSILMAFVLVFAMGCEGCAKGVVDDGEIIIKPAPEQAAPTFELNQSQIECIVGDIDKLSPKSLPNIGEASLTWRSENSKIVTVDSNGNFEAMSEGTTKVIATYGTLSAECIVKVSWDEELPQIVSPVSADGKFSIIVAQEYKFTPAIQYRGKIYNDGELTVSVSDSAVTALDVATSTITGLTKGTSNVTISGTWRGKEALLANFNVTVSDNVFLSAVGKEDESDVVQLFTQAETFENTSDQKTTSEFTPTAQIKADTNSEPEILDIKSNPNIFDVIIEDNSIVSYDKASQKLSAISFGDTTVTINFEYEDQTFIKQYFLHIERPVMQFRKSANYFSSYKGTLRDEGDSFKLKTLKEFVYGSREFKVETAYIDDQELQIEANGAILGVTGPSNSTYEVVIRIGTAVEQYDVKTRVYGQYVYKPTDLDVFVRTAASPELDVYVELAKDLDLSNYEKPNNYNDIDTSSGSTDPNKNIVPDNNWIKNKFVSKGFTGTFNGNGYNIMNYTLSDKYGLFAGLTNATIMNVGFVSCDLKASTFFAIYANNLTMENVYIQLNSMMANSGYFGTGVVSLHKSPGGRYTNVFIDLEKANVEASYPGGNTWGRYSAINYSAFVKFPDETDVQPVFKNCLVISKAPISSTTVNVDVPVRVVLAENTTEEERTQFRQKVWEGHVDRKTATTEARDKAIMISSYTSRFKNDKLGIYPNPATFAEDESLYIEYINNANLAKYDNDITRTAPVCRTLGVIAYDTVADMKKDSTSREYLTSFSNAYWTVLDGELNWGRHPAGIKDGDVFLDVGELKNKQVEGISLNPLRGCTEGQTVEVGALSCFGYIFEGWVNNTTGEKLEFKDGKYSFTYDGRATILVAQWRIDPNVQVNSGNK